MVWRVGRRPDPLRVRDPRPLPPDETKVGNRFDSLAGRFSCLHLASDSRVCFMEVLGRLKPNQRLAALVSEEWESRGWMHVGNVPADWAWSHRSHEFPDGFAGIRYISRMDSSQECWGVFDDIEVREIGRTPIAPRDPDVRYAAEKLDLTIH